MDVAKAKRQRKRQNAFYAVFFMSKIKLHIRISSLNCLQYEQGNQSYERTKILFVSVITFAFGFFLDNFHYFRH